MKVRPTPPASDRDGRLPALCACSHALSIFFLVLSQLTSIKNLLGRPNQRFLLFGMLGRTATGDLCLEDGDGIVTLDMEETVSRYRSAWKGPRVFSKRRADAIAARLQSYGTGMFTEGCLVLVEGEYTDEEVMRVIEMGHPPSEKRAVARSIYGHVDFLGVGATSLKDEVRHLSQLCRSRATRADKPPAAPSRLSYPQEKYDRIVKAHNAVTFIFISDLWLDHPKTLVNLRRMLEVYADAVVPPLAFILCGNFSSVPCTVGGAAGLAKYTGQSLDQPSSVHELPLTLVYR